MTGKPCRRVGPSRRQRYRCPFHPGGQSGDEYVPERSRLSWRQPAHPCSPALSKAWLVPVETSPDCRQWMRRSEANPYSSFASSFRGWSALVSLPPTPNTDPFSGRFVEDLRLAARRAGMRLEPVLVNGPSEFESAYATMAKAETQAVIVQGLFDPHRMRLIELASKYRLAYLVGQPGNLRCRGSGLHLRELCSTLRTGRALCGQDHQGRKPGEFAGGAADEISGGNQY